MIGDHSEMIIDMCTYVTCDALSKMPRKAVQLKQATSFLSSCLTLLQATVCGPLAPYLWVVQGVGACEEKWIKILFKQTSWSVIRHVIHVQPVKSLRGEG